MATTLHSYVLPDELRAVIGTPNGQDDRVAVACALGSLWVDRYLGIAGSPDGLPVDPYQEPPFTVERAPTTTLHRHQGALLAAERVWRGVDVPLGVAGGLGDLAVRVYSLTIPEAELVLYGERQEHAWGVA